MRRNLTKYERKIRLICTRNKFPFTRSGKITVGGKNPDFINREKKLILEVFNDERTDETRQERIYSFYQHGYSTLFITEDDFNKPKWKEYITGAIRGFLE